MPTVNIDGKAYEMDNLSDEAKGNVVSLQFVQNELKRLEAQTAVYRTAEIGYMKALKGELDESTTN